MTSRILGLAVKIVILSHQQIKANQEPFQDHHSNLRHCMTLLILIFRLPHLMANNLDPGERKISLTSRLQRTPSLIDPLTQSISKNIKRRRPKRIPLKARVYYPFAEDRRPELRHQAMPKPNHQECKGSQL